MIIEPVACTKAAARAKAQCNVLIGCYFPQQRSLPYRHRLPNFEPTQLLHEIMEKNMPPLLQSLTIRWGALHINHALWKEILRVAIFWRIVKNNGAQKKTKPSE
jgi:hypothetical protein